MSPERIGDSFRYLLLGQNVLSVLIDPKLIDLLPASFGPYWTENVAYSMGVITMKPLLDIHSCGNADGWVDSQAGNMHIVTYCVHGVVLFVLTYENINKVDVWIRQGDAKGFSLGLQHAMLIALSDRCIGLHGATLICKDRLVTLSAPSGTGKTTLANLLRKYSEAALINGDFALVSVVDEQVVFEPTPFCGTSGCCLNYRLPLSNIVFLSQSLQNTYRAISPREAIISLLSNVFVPDWDSSISDRIHQTVFKIASVLKFSAYAFAPNREAALMFDDLVNK